MAHGVLNHFWIQNGLHRWHVLYDDGYSENFDIAEMIAFGENKESGSAATLPVDKPIDVSDSTDQNPNPWKQ